MPTYEIRIEPLDPLLFGDNRSARAGLDHLQQDQDPSPLTVHGAIGRYLASRSKNWPAELLGDEQKDILNPKDKVAELRGFCARGVGGSLFFPRPRHLRCLDDNGAHARSTSSLLRSAAAPGLRRRGPNCFSPRTASPPATKSKARCF